MVEVLIGAGGWNYFNIPRDRLRNYARAFKTVEVNTTYYTIPPLSMVEGWRNRVPEEFEFTVRCNRELTRGLRSKPFVLSYEVFEKMKRICSLLRTNILHVQISSNFKLKKEIVDRIDDFLSSVNLSTLRLAWEIRSASETEIRSLLHILENYNVIHCVDLSRENPAYESDIIYSRLFGKGIHNIYQFTNSELENIDAKVKASKAEKAYLNFHGARMYKDAARISIYETTKKFPKVTNGVGVDAVLEVLKEDAEFPSSTSELIKHQGWKVCEWSDEEQLHISEVLGRIGEKKFNNISELEETLHKYK